MVSDKRMSWEPIPRYSRLIPTVIRSFPNGMRFYTHVRWLRLAALR